MDEYPSQSPFGPHGPQLSEPSVTPNPTAETPPPSFEAYDPGQAPPVSYPGTGGSGGAVGAALPAFAGQSIGTWMRNFAIAGGALGCLVGATRGLVLHQPSGIIGVLVVRLGVAGAATGASIPPAFRVLGSMIRAAVWLVIALLLWAIAMAAAGQTGWLTRLR
jgi:hypothetical protein